MAAYDWIESKEFADAVRSRIQERLAYFKLEGLPYVFTSMLVDIAKANRGFYEDRASRKIEPINNMEAALLSVDEIIATAISLALDAKRKSITQEDVSRAIQMHFCKIWPFCR